MANPQLEDGYLKISNELFEAITMAVKFLTKYEMAVFLAITRLTYGYNKKEAKISQKELRELTKILPPHLTRAKKTLIERNMIEVGKNGIKIQKNYELWNLEKLPHQVTENNEKELPHQVIPVTSPGNSQLPHQVIPVTSPGNFSPEAKYIFKDKYKDNYKDKEFLGEKRDKVKKEEVKINIPSWIDPTTWHDYLEMRKKIRRPATGRAQELVIKKLDQLRAEGQDPNRVLEQSIENSWQGVFPLKPLDASSGYQKPLRASQTGKNPDISYPPGYWEKVRELKSKGFEGEALMAELRKIPAFAESKK